MKNKGSLLLLIGILAAAIMAAGCSQQEKAVSNSQQYPIKPITMIVSFSAGGSADLMARAMEKSAVKHLGQALVVTNITGGGATIGWNELAGAKPDGYTIGYVAASALLQPLYGQTRYHYATALDPLAQVMSIPLIVTVPVDQPWNSIEELVEYAKQHPGEIKFGHSGLGTAVHVAGELFGKETGIDIVQVPFRGEGESLAALLGGHVQLTFATAPSIKEYVKNGKVKALGILGEQRINDPIFTNVPTLKEQGRNMVFHLWYGIAAPKDLPADVKNRLITGLRDIIQDPEFLKQIEGLGMTAEYLGPKEFGEKWLSESTRLEKIVKETGIAERIAAQKK